ncbi:MAG: MBL fold metallo-hydrolase, partial [Acinetobacter sp.]
MLKYLLKTPDAAWTAASPASATAENLKIKY